MTQLGHFKMLVKKNAKEECETRVEMDSERRLLAITNDTYISPRHWPAQIKLAFLFSFRTPRSLNHAPRIAAGGMHPLCDLDFRTEPDGRRARVTDASGARNPDKTPRILLASVTSPSISRRTCRRVTKTAQQTSDSIAV